MSKPKLFVSFSGGRTSAYMSWRIKTELADRYDLLFLFANTGQEDERTLAFVDRCDREFGLGVVWIEADIDPRRGKGVRHRVVDYRTADRSGRASFEPMIAKLGIPNKNYPHCTRELKERPMYSYLREIGWGGEASIGKNFEVAIGIRADEPRRIGSRPGIVYPLAHWWPTDKSDVVAWWEDQSFDLGLEERLGNCVWCWKKSLRKHLLNMQHCPDIYDFPAEMEAVHAHAGAGTGPRVFFREGAFCRSAPRPGRRDGARRSHGLPR